MDPEVHGSTRGIGNRGRTIYTGNDRETWFDSTLQLLFFGRGRGALEEPAIWHHSPATETKALCSAMPPLVTMRSVYTPSSSLYRLGIVSLVNPLPVSIFTHLESKRRTSGE